MKDSNDFLASLMKLAILLGGAALAIIYSAFVMQKIIMYFNIPLVLTNRQLIGICILASVLLLKPAKPKNTYDEKKEWYIDILNFFIANTILWGIGYVMSIIYV